MSLKLLQKRLTSTRSRGPTDAEIAQMIKDLDADEYPVREKASADQNPPSRQPSRTRSP